MSNKELYLGDAELRERNQITVPSSVIALFFMKPGDKLLFIKKGQSIIVEKRNGIVKED